MAAERETRDVGGLVSELTLDEKVALTAGVDQWHTPAVGRLGIGRLKMTDGPVGARGSQFGGGPPSACFPCGTALAATWDTELVRRVGAELGAETRAKGAHILLAPTVNMHRTPLAGRSFECYSEDPYLAGRTATAYINGVQSTGAGACIKHLVANDSEFERLTMSSDVPERALREIYLRPFEMAIADARPVAVMAAYNRLNGAWCSEHPGLLTAILREEWGFDGLVVSDWGATHSTAAALDAGLDLEMPGPPRHRGERLRDAVERGEVSEARLDTAVGRILDVAARTGALDAGPGDERAEDPPERRAVARDAARASVVLLRNDPAAGGLPVLPLDGARSVAVVGPGADALHILGGGSAAVSPHYAVSPLDGLRARLPDAAISHEPGCEASRYPPLLDPRWLTAPDGSPGLGLEYLAGTDASGPVVSEQTARRAAIGWSIGFRPAGVDEWSLRLRAELRVPVSGDYDLQLRAPGRFRLVLDEEVVIDGWEAPAEGAGRRGAASVRLEAGSGHALCAELAPAEGEARPRGIELRCRRTFPEDSMERAVRAAADADVAVVVVGTGSDWETEGRDRTTLALPGLQDALVERVLDANPRTAVVVNAGSPVAMPWAARAPAILQLWFTGQEMGNALADILAGDVSPSGRLPTTFPRRIEDTPAYLNYPGEFGHVLYGEGLYVGYRWYDARDIAPLFGFGHGLSYTTFAYGPATVTGTDPATVTVEVTNTGDRAGAEVVQAYVREVEPRALRPPKELKGFAKVFCQPGETRTVSMGLDDRAFSFWDPEQGGWRPGPGPFEVLVGASAADIRSRAVLPSVE